VVALTVQVVMAAKLPDKPRNRDEAVPKSSETLVNAPKRGVGRGVAMNGIGTQRSIGALWADLCLE
jgi:hypothetical protein